MKHFYLFIILCFCTVLALAQDTAHKQDVAGMKKVPDMVVKRDGEKLFVVLTEVNPDDIRYKRFDYQDGPSFTLPKQDIRYIVYANGTRESYDNYTPPASMGNSTDPSIQPSKWGYYYKERYLTEPDMLDVAEKLHDKKLDLMIYQVQKRRVWHTISLLGGIFLMADGAYFVIANRSVRYHRGGACIFQYNCIRGRESYNW